jgi:RNA polymerase sigma factor (sigma-70 family)
MPAAAIRVPLARTRLQRLDDERLAELAGTGDERAFEVLYDRHHRALLGFCRHLLGSRDEAEDALQQTFLRAHRALLVHGPPEDLRPWLFTIARNRCKTLLAARRQDAPGDDEVEPSTEGLGSDVERRADLRALLADLGRLPEDQRSALVLAELADMPHTEIAAVIGVPVGKVKALVHQARNRLIAEREARETPCEEIREQLATASGGALRRGPLRRHLRGCEPCRAYRARVAEQRSALGLLLPALPSAGLKDAILGAAAGGGGGAAAAAGGGAAAAGSGLLSGAGGSVVAKLAVGAALVGGAGGGAVAVERAVDDLPRKDAKTVIAPRAPAVAPMPASAEAEDVLTTTETAAPGGTRRGTKTRESGATKRGARAEAKRRSRASENRGDERRSERGAERSAGAPGQLKTAKGPATGRAVGRQRASAAPGGNGNGRAVRRRPNAGADPPVRVKPTPPAKPAPGSRRSERAAPKPVKAQPPAEAAEPVAPKVKKNADEAAR